MPFVLVFAIFVFLVLLFIFCLCLGMDILSSDVHPKTMLKRY